MRFKPHEPRPATVRAASWNPTERTIEIVFLANEGIERKTWDDTTFREVIPMSVGRFERFKGRASIFVQDGWGHSTEPRRAIGVIQDWWQEAGDAGLPQGVCRARLTDAPGVADDVHKVVDGTLPNVSVGYDVDGWNQEVVEGVTVRTATGWEALEVNVVGVSADAGAHVRVRGVRQMDDAAKFMAAIVLLAGDDKPLSKVYKEVGKAAGLTPDDVKAFAEGTAEPEPEQLGPLAQALGLQVQLADTPADPPAEDSDADGDDMPSAEDDNTDPERAEEEPDMANATDVAAETKRVSDITRVALQHGRSADLQGWIDNKTSLSDVRAKILDDMANEDDTPGITGGQRADIRVNRDEGDTVRASFMAAIWARGRNVSLAEGARMMLAVDGEDQPDANKVAAVAAGARRFMGRRLVDSSRMMLGHLGLDVVDLGDAEVSKVALGGRVASYGRATLVTADVSNLLTNVANKSLLKGLGDYPAIYRRIAAWSPTGDFRPKRPVMLSSMPDLKKIPEGGDVEPGTLTDKIESYTPERRGRMIVLSVEMLQNDDLGALMGLPGTAGRRIERDRDTLLLGLVNTGHTTTLLADGVALFATAHRNLAAVAGAPSDTTLDAALQTMGLQQNIDGDPEPVFPRIALVPVAHQGTMLRLKQGTYGPTTAATAQIPWIRDLDVISHGLLDTVSSTAWYLFADPNDWPAFEWTEVSGHAPKVESEFDFDSDALKFKVVHSFGVGAVDQRGGFRNAGA